MADNILHTEDHAMTITFGQTDGERQTELQAVWEHKKQQWEEEIRKIFTPENESPKAEISISGGISHARFNDVSGQSARHDDIPNGHSRYSSDFNLGKDIEITDITKFIVSVADAIDPVAHENEARIITPPPGTGRNIWLQLSRDGIQGDGDYSVKIIYTAQEDSETVLTRIKALNHGIKVEDNKINYEYNKFDIPLEE